MKSCLECKYFFITTFFPLKNENLTNGTILCNKKHFEESLLCGREEFLKLIDKGPRCEDFLKG
jgi:hypothetical protein